MSCLAFGANEGGLLGSGLSEDWLSSPGGKSLILS